MDIVESIVDIKLENSKKYDIEELILCNISVMFNNIEEFNLLMDIIRYHCIDTFSSLPQKYNVEEIVVSLNYNYMPRGKRSVIVSIDKFEDYIKKMFSNIPKIISVNQIKRG